MRQRQIYYGKGARNKSLDNAKTFVKNVNSSKKKLINNLPKYDTNILIHNLSLWKNKIKEIYSEEVILQFETLFDKIELKKGTSGFTQFRNKKHENKEQPLIKPCENKNRENFGKSNIEDRNEWKNIDENIKKDYRTNCLKKNIIFNLEFSLVNNLLFLGYDPIEKRFKCSAKNIYFVHVKIVLLKFLYDGFELNEDYKSIMEQLWLKLNEEEKALYFNKKEKLNNLIKEINSFSIPNVVKLYKDDIKNNNAQKEKSYNNSIYLKAWKLLDNSKKEKYYQKKEQLIAINEIILNILKIKNFEFLNSPYQASQLFIKDLKNNFIAYKNINIENGAELWTKCAQSIKQSYEKKYLRLIIEYNFLKLIKEKIKNYVVKKIKVKRNYNEIKINFLNKINNTNIQLTKKEIKEKINNLNEEQKRELRRLLRQARKESKKDVLNKIRFEITQKNFSAKNVFDKENMSKVLSVFSRIKQDNKDKEINEVKSEVKNNSKKSDDSNKTIMYSLYKSLNETEKAKYIGKRIFLNKLRQKRLEQLEKNFYYEIDEYEWYFRKGFKYIPENPSLAKALLNDVDKKDKIKEDEVDEEEEEEEDMYDINEQNEDEEENESIKDKKKEKINMEKIIKKNESKGKKSTNEINKINLKENKDEIDIDLNYKKNEYNSDINNHNNIVDENKSNEMLKGQENENIINGNKINKELLINKISLSLINFNDNNNKRQKKNAKDKNVKALKPSKKTKKQIRKEKKIIIISDDYDEDNINLISNKGKNLKNKELINNNNKFDIKSKNNIVNKIDKKENKKEFFIDEKNNFDLISIKNKNIENKNEQQNSLNLLDNNIINENIICNDYNPNNKEIQNCINLMELEIEENNKKEKNQINIESNSGYIDQILNKDNTDNNILDNSQIDNYQNKSNNNMNNNYYYDNIINNNDNNDNNSSNNNSMDIEEEEKNDTEIILSPVIRSKIVEKISKDNIKNIIQENKYEYEDSLDDDKNINKTKKSKNEEIKDNESILHNKIKKENIDNYFLDDNKDNNTNINIMDISEKNVNESENNSKKFKEKISSNNSKRNKSNINSKRRGRRSKDNIIGQTSIKDYVYVVKNAISENKRLRRENTYHCKYKKEKENQDKEKDKEDK